MAGMKVKLSTALAAKEALMIGPHSSDILERHGQEILTLRRALTDRPPLGEKLAGVHDVTARGEKRLSLAVDEKAKAMEALQAAQDKITQQRHQRELDTLQAKIVSASNVIANTVFREDSLDALKSLVEATEVVAAFQTIRLQQVNDDMDSENNEREETPKGAWTTVKNRRLNLKETPQLTHSSSCRDKT